MSMDLYSTGIPWKNKSKDPKYINFNSEVVVRKGDEGWVINSKLDNYSDGNKVYFDYILTTYKYEENKWNEKSKKWWEDTRTMDGTTAEYKISDANYKAVYVVWAYNDKLVIKTPKESWWDKNGWVSPTTGNHKIVGKIKTETKNWSGVWIDDTDRGEDSWIFEDIELYIKEKQNSLVFCKEENSTCFAVYQQNNDKRKKLNEQNSDSWSVILKGNTKENEKVTSIISDTVKPIIDKIKGSRGTWLDLETVCNLKETRNLDDSQKKQLSMYCTNGKKV